MSNTKYGGGGGGGGGALQLRFTRRCAPLCFGGGLNHYRLAAAGFGGCGSNTEALSVFAILRFIRLVFVKSADVMSNYLNVATHNEKNGRHISELHCAKMCHKTV